MPPRGARAPWSRLARAVGGRDSLRGSRIRLGRQVVRKSTNSRKPEHIDHRNLFLESFAQSAVHSHQLQGMSAQIEEIILSSDLGDSQNFLPDGCDLLFGFVARFPLHNDGF